MPGTRSNHRLLAALSGVHGEQRLEPDRRGDHTPQTWFIGPKGENADLLRRLVGCAIDHNIAFRHDYMPGYPQPDPEALALGAVKPWGHITCDGSVADAESLRAARNLMYFPVALAEAIRVDLAGRIDMVALRAALDAGLDAQTPVMRVTAVLGSTEQSAVAPLTGTVAIREEYRAMGMEFSIHADGARCSSFASLPAGPPGARGRVAEAGAGAGGNAIFNLLHPHSRRRVPSIPLPDLSRRGGDDDLPAGPEPALRVSQGCRLAPRCPAVRLSRKSAGPSVTRPLPDRVPSGRNDRVCGTRECGRPRRGGSAAPRKGQNRMLT